MKNKEIQEKRIKGYFIQATKEIIQGEGVQALSVRNIADRAGYSYATLYNYFKDVNDLIFYCLNDFQNDCKLFVERNTTKEEKGIESLKGKVMAYMHYFIEYPGIFDLFYILKMDGIHNKASMIQIIDNSMESICELDWAYCRSNKLMSEKKIETLKAQLKYTVIGLLVFYLNRISPESYTEFIKNANKQIDILFNS